MSGERALWAVIPALDEQETIEAVVADVRAQVDGVLVVDNGSADSTAQRAARAGARVVAEPRRGYGRACVAGARAAPAGCVLVYCDADGSDDPRALRRVAAPVLAGQADLVGGSRARGRQQPGSQLLHQRLANWLFAAALRHLWRVAVTDLGPMRALRRETLLDLDMQSQTYGWPIELLLKAARRGLRVEEVAVDWRRRAGGRSKVSGSLRASLRAGLCFTRAMVVYGMGPRR